MTRIEWHAFPKEKPSVMEPVLIVSYDNNNRPVVGLGCYDSILRRWSTMFGPLAKPVSHFAFCPDLPADVLTPAQVRELEDK